MTPVCTIGCVLRCSSVKLKNVAVLSLSIWLCCCGCQMTGHIPRVYKWVKTINGDYLKTQFCRRMSLAYISSCSRVLSECNAIHLQFRISHYVIVYLVINGDYVTA